MIRRIQCAALALAAAFLIAPAAAADEEPRPAPKPRVSLTMPLEGMAVVPVGYAVVATPARDLGRFRSVVQVRTTARGWVTLDAAPLDRRGRSTGTVVSNRPGTKDYRAALLTAKGRVVSASSVKTIAWAPLEHRVELTCEESSSRIEARVPCTITVSPPVRLDDLVVSLQMQGRTEWFNLESFRVPPKGIIRTDVMGRVPGSVDYRVRLLRNAKVLNESNVVAIAYS